jgi:hypothetical protein
MIGDEPAKLRESVTAWVRTGREDQAIIHITAIVSSTIRRASQPEAEHLYQMREQRAAERVMSWVLFPDGLLALMLTGGAIAVLAELAASSAKPAPVPVRVRTSDR